MVEIWLVVLVVVVGRSAEKREGHVDQRLAKCVDALQFTINKRHELRAFGMLGGVFTQAFLNPTALRRWTMPLESG